MDFLLVMFRKTFMLLSSLNIVEKILTIKEVATIFSVGAHVYFFSLLCMTTAKWTRKFEEFNMVKTKPLVLTWLFTCSLFWPLPPSLTTFRDSTFMKVSVGYMAVGSKSVGNLSGREKSVRYLSGQGVVHRECVPGGSVLRRFIRESGHLCILRTFFLIISCQKGSNTLQIVFTLPGECHVATFLQCPFKSNVM